MNPPASPSEHHTGTMSHRAAATDTSAPTLVSGPRDGQAVDGALVFTFSEAIKLALDATLTVRLNYAAVATIALLNNPAVTLDGATLTVALPQRLDYATPYSIDFSPRAIVDLAGNAGWFYDLRFQSGLSPTAIQVTGTATAEGFSGSDLADTIDGGGGSDNIKGYGGDDLLYGGADTHLQHGDGDWLDGGAGNDSLWGGGGNDELAGGSGNDKLYGEDGDDRLDGGDGDDLLDGGQGNDTLLGGAGANTLRGGDGDDRLRSIDFSATGLLDGGKGKDILEGLTGIDYAGGEGDDLIQISFDPRAHGATGAGGGAGKDSFHLLMYGPPTGPTTISGGADADTYVPRTSESTRDSGVTITDFTPGAGGDLIDLRAVYTGSGAGNPFDNGSLRLLASGADTLFQQRDLKSGAYVTVLTLAGLMPSQLLAANFVDGFDPLGGTRGVNLSGGPGADSLHGTRLDDTLSGLDGDDTLAGGQGDDVLDGGAGNDVLDGEEGDDILRGGDGDDRLIADTDGKDLLDGGAGNDRLTSRGNADTLLGGAGNDVLVLIQGVFALAQSTVTMAGDGGDDLFDIESAFHAVSVVASGGEGADTFRFNERAASVTVTITDFGAADVLDLRQALPYNLSGNPFGASGHLKAVQDGADLRILLDADGAAGPGAARTVVTLSGVSLAALSQRNFAGGYDPAGGSKGLTLTGSAGADVLAGTVLDDSIDGGAGDDRIDGGDGHDRLAGGDGADLINGNAGDDTLEGGDESILGTGDELDGGAGNDTLSGGAGNDRLRGGAGQDKLHGDAGNDRLDGGDGDDLLEGGDGDDILEDSSGNNDLRGGAGNDTLGTSHGLAGDSLLDGGAGNDTILAGINAGRVFGGGGDDDIAILGVGGPAGALRAEGGDGNDRFTVSNAVPGQRAVTLAGGAGTDRYAFQDWDSGGTGSVTIADFQGGSGGDVVDLYSLVPDAAGSPFASGHLRLQQDGARVLLQLDRDGAGGPQGWVTRIVFDNMSVGGFTAANFTEGLSPDGSATGLQLDGGAGADRLAGARLDDQLRGLGGADVLEGKAGNDLLQGGDGNDALDGGVGNDRLEGGAGDDSLVDTAGDNSFHGGDGNDSIQSGTTGYSQVSGDGGNDILNGGGTGSYDGGDGDDQIQFYATSCARPVGTVQLRGGAGADWILVSLNGAPLAVSIEGGSGSDVFQPRGSTQGGSVTIADFTTGAGGDQLDLAGLGHPDGRNPFAADGFLRLQQRGADTVLQLRANGAWQDSVLLLNVAQASFSAANFVLGFDPLGSSNALPMTGSAADDTLSGGWLDDRIDGAGGNDMLEGGAGDDLLLGGDGHDWLDGDRPINDDLPSRPWSAGWQNGDDRLEGGAGNDLLVSRWGNDSLAGGDGNDQLDLRADPGIQAFRLSMDGGAGQDRLRILATNGSASQVTMRGGEGSDSFTVAARPQGYSIAILDFAAGEGGDVLDIFQLADSGGQPFTLGFYALEQRGADTVVRFDADGAAGGASGWVDLLTLRNVASGALSAANMRGGYLPGSPAPAPGLERIGGGGGDRLVGDSGDDLLDGGAGNDLLRGGAGDDVLVGGAGRDTALFGGRRADYGIGAPSWPNGASVSDRRGGVNDGSDTLFDVERLVFADGAIAFDTGTQGVAGQAYRIYRAAFDRPADEAGLGFWMAMMDGGVALVDIAGGFVRSQEFVDLYGAAPTHAQIVTRMYTNILDRAPEQAGYDYWLKALDDKLIGVAEMLAMFSESAENRYAVAGLIGDGVAYQPYGA